ncbi:MAG: ribonuclease III [Blastomonas sp.]
MDSAALARLTGHDIGDPALFHQALTHGSTGEAADYQRLEFLGDRVLGLTIAELLYQRFPRASEGQMAAWYNRLVSRETCATVAQDAGINDHIRLGKQARDDGGSKSINILGDVTEAIIGALYLDGGMAAASGFIARYWDAMLQAIEQAPKHPKSALQEWAAANRRKTPSYELVSRDGPDHDLRFTVRVSINGIGEVTATGNSKQEAETLAAQEFMKAHIA